MKTYFPSYIRIPVIFFAVAGAIEYLIDTGSQPAFIKHPEVLGLLMLFLFVLIAFEICYAAIENFMSKVEVSPSKPAWYASFINYFTKPVTIEEEEAVELNHNYDGIKELDNSLPPWWVYLFYATIVFAAIYLIRSEVFDQNSQIDEFNTEVKVAEIQFEEWKKTAKDYVDVSSVTLLTTAADLSTGKKLYDQNCAVCHKVDGGGSIGPNLTDKNWILGGGVKNIFKTISKGGRPDKGMEAWGKKGLKAMQIQQISSYIIGLEGSNPDNGKQPEGEIWEEKE